jgi:phage-related protein
MFDFSFSTFELFSFVIFASLPVLFGDMEDWIPDSDSWLGKQFGFIVNKVRDFFLWIVEQIRGFIDTVLTGIQNIGNGIWELVSNLWSYLRQAFQTVLDFFANIWDWLVENVTRTYEFFADLVSSVWDTFVETLELVWESGLEILWYIGEWLFEFVLACGDSLVGLCIDMVLWLFDKVLPAIDMPQGFEQGVTYFIQFGMLLNEILPIRESLSLFALYITIRVGLGVFRFVKSMPYKLMLGSFGG